MPNSAPPFPPSASCSLRAPWFLAVACALTLSLVRPVPVAAQSDPISISFGTHALTAPWYLAPMNDRLNPAFLVGTDRPIRSGDRWRSFYAINLSFFRDHWWMTGISIEPEIGIGRDLPAGFHADLRLGLGYMHYFWRRETLELKDGRYVEATSWGKPSLILPLSATLAYRGDSDSRVSVQPFVSMRWGIQGLFLDEIPAATHVFLLGGVRLQRKTPPGGGQP